MLDYCIQNIFIQRLYILHETCIKKIYIVYHFDLLCISRYCDKLFRKLLPLARRCTHVHTHTHIYTRIIDKQRIC